MTNLSKTLSILIPMYNEEGTIEDTIQELIQRGFHERYEIVVCDDDSTDGSATKVQDIANTHESISLIAHKPNGNKIGAISTGMSHIKTRYVLLLDADATVLELTKGYLDNLVLQMHDQDITAIGFKIQAQATNIFESFQALEYTLSTDGLRWLLGTTGCLSGVANLWRVDRLETILARHSGIFEGDDLEITMLATLFNFDVAFETREVIATTNPKRNIGELFRQRMNIWDIGLIQVFFSTHWFLKQRGQNGAFFNAIFITEILAHPFKILSIIGIFLTFFLTAINSLDIMPKWRLLFQLNDSILSILQSTSWIYLLLWLFTVLSIFQALLPHPHTILNGLRLVLYFTFYMATPLIPLISTSFGQMIGATYLWWYSLCAVLILISTETWETKLRSLLLSFLMPFYFAVLFVFPRTLGFIKYIVGRVQGKYTRQPIIFHA